MNTEEQLHEQIARMVQNVLGLDQPIADDDFDLMLVGLSSLNAIRIVVEMESKFQITVSDDELVMSNFNTVGKLKRLVRRNS